jgi:hypothetical protein
MQIIWNEEAARQLASTHTVLELETIQIPEIGAVTAYCIVPAEKIPLTDFPKLDALKQLHAQFVQAYRDKNYKFCTDAMEHLMGAFGGEADTFYEEIAKRILDTK